MYKMSVAILYYCPEYRSLYYLINDHYYAAESLDKVTLKDKLELIEVMEVDSNGYVTGGHMSQSQNGKITNLGKRVLLTQAVFIKTTTGWVVLNNSETKVAGLNCVFNTICVMGSTNTFDGTIEYISDIHYLNIPNLNTISPGLSYDKLQLPEFNLLLFNQLLSIQRNKLSLFEQLISADRDGVLIKINEHRQTVKDLLSTYVVDSTKIITVKNRANYLHYLDEEILTDIIFMVNEVPIKAHKIILAEASEYFRRLFTSSFRERNQDIITINDISIRAFIALIRVIYGEDIWNLHWDLILEVVILIQRYQVTKFNIKELLTKVEIPPEGFIKLIETINSLYDEITPDVIGIIASKIKNEVDLSTLSNEFINEILTSSQYQPVNLEVTTNMLNHLKIKGIEITI